MMDRQWLERRLKGVAAYVVEEFVEEADKDRSRWPTFESADPLREQLYVMLDGAVGDFEILAQQGPAETISERWLDRP